MLAVRLGGERDLYSSRSLGTSGPYKRRTLVLTFPPRFNRGQEAFYTLLGELVDEANLRVDELGRSLRVPGARLHP